MVESLGAPESDFAVTEPQLCDVAVMALDLMCEHHINIEPESVPILLSAFRADSVQKIRSLAGAVVLLVLLVGCTGNWSDEATVSYVETRVAQFEEAVSGVISTIEAWENELEAREEFEVASGTPVPTGIVAAESETGPDILVTDIPDMVESVDPYVEEREIYRRIQNVYDKEIGIMYPYSFDQLLERSQHLKTNENRYFIISIENPRAEDDARLITKICYVLMGEKAFDILREVRQVEMDEWVFAWADPHGRIIGIGDSNISFVGDMGAKRKTAIHEIAHIIDIGQGIFDVETVFKLEEIKAKALSDQDVLRMYDWLYMDIDATYTTDDNGVYINPFFNLGDSAIRAFDTDPSQRFFQDEHINAQFTNEMLSWQSNGWSVEDRLRVARLLFESRMYDPQFEFSDEDLENSYRHVSYELITESWAQFIAMGLSGDGTIYNQDQGLKENLRQYIQLASGRPIGDVEELINALRFEGGLLDVDEPVEVILEN
jgi:hypothetical protein